MHKGFFVTGTDTGVGKTVVAAAVVRALVMLGYHAGAMKPVETGCVRSGDMLLPSDGMFLKRIAAMDEHIGVVTPVMYETPLSPYSAGEREGRIPDRKRIFSAFYDLSRRYDVMVVEGAGGLCVPIFRDYFMADLAREMELPLLIVARPLLGTINHTLLTIHYARARGLDVAGVIFNYSAPPGETIAEETNPRVLQGLTDVPLLGVFPYLSVLEEAVIDRAVVKTFNLGMVRELISRAG